MTRFLIAISVFLIMPLTVAQWRADQDAEVCITGTGVSSLDIAVCGRALAGGDLSELDRASVHVARGKALRDSGKPSRAIADFDAAANHNPYSATAFHERALTLDRSGQFEQALHDFDRAIELSPRFGHAYRNRGIALFYAGFPTCARADLDAAAAISRDDGDVYAFRGFINYMDGRYAEAAKDFDRVEALGLPYPYLPLWSYLSRARSGLRAEDVLVDAEAGLMPGEWPGPLLAVYRRERDGDDLTATFEIEDPSADRRRRLAEAHLYLALLDQADGHGREAGRHFENAAALAAYRTPERVLAEAALARGPGESGSCPKT